MSAPNKCPQCGEFVSLFAAGCAVCGAELDPARGQYRSPSARLRALLERLSGGRPGERRTS